MKTCASVMVRTALVVGMVVEKAGCLWGGGMIAMIVRMWSWHREVWEGR